VEARDRQTDGQDQHMMGPPSRKNGPIIILKRQEDLLRHQKMKLSPE